MSKVRIYLLAKELGIKTTDLVESLKDLGVEVKSHMSTIDEETARIIKDMFKEEAEKNLEKKTKKTENLVVVQPPVNIKNLADAMGKKPNTIMKKLIEKGLMVNLTQQLAGPALAEVEKNLNIKVEVEKELPKPTDKEKTDVKPEDMVTRPPVVTVMGHVDHGKTLLLDTIRKTNVIASEAGGITQHIGAYQVEGDGKKITFLDTPGHEAFTAMRARGAKATDIAILVVAADDGVMPQTIEAINHARSANVPIIVAINKIDKPGANPDRVKQQLADKGLVPEDWGGETICVEISALRNENIDELLEMILLVAEIEDFRAPRVGKAAGIVIEAQLDKGRGPVATVLIQKGMLRVGDPVIVGYAYGKVRAMFDDKGQKLDEAAPSMPVEVLGFSEVPRAGDRLLVTEDERTARHVAEERHVIRRQDELVSAERPINLEEFFQQVQEGKTAELRLILKCDVQGSAEALKEALKRIKSDEVKMEIIHSGVGGITESDIILAAASNAIIIGFNVRPDAKASKMADREKVDIRTYRVIYQVIDDVKKALEGLLAPDIQEKVIGRAEVRRTFRVPKIGTIAGLYVREGKITRNAQVRLIRDGVVIHEGTINSLKRFQDDVREVEENYECGLGLDNFQDVREKDVIEAFIFEEIKRSLD